MARRLAWLVLVVGIVACSSVPLPTPTSTPAPSATPLPTATPVPTTTPSIKDAAQQILEERQRVTAIQTMTGLLQEQTVAEAQATNVALGAKISATFVALSVQQTSTAVSRDLAVQATQQPIIASATVEAAKEAAGIKATAIVDAAVREQQLAAQGTATAQALPAYEWRARYDAAALLVATCAEAREIANQTQTVEQARSLASENRYFTTSPVGHCP